MAADRGAGPNDRRGQGRGRSGAPALVLLAVVVLSGCQFTSAGRFGSPVPVTVRTEVVANGSRQLSTVVYTPAVAGPLPLVVFAHGWDNDPSTYDPLLRTWAAAGFEVAAPRSPGLDPGAGPLDHSQLVRQPSDLAAVITRLVAEGGIDATRIAVAGHSDGGTTVARMALVAGFRDARVRSYLVLSGARPAGSVPARDGAPLLVMIGDHDEYGNWPGTVGVYVAGAAPRALVRIVDGRHLAPYVDGSLQASAVRAATTDFLVAALRYGPWAPFDVAAARGGLRLSSEGIP